MLLVAGPFVVPQLVYDTADERAWWQGIVTMSTAGLAVLIMWLGVQKVRRAMGREAARRGSGED